MNSFVDDEILDECGMDSLCFLRLLNMGFKISLCAVINAIWLIPTYKYSPLSSETANITDPIVQITISNVPSGSAVLIAPVLASYIFFGFIMKLIVEVSNETCVSIVVLQWKFNENNPKISSFCLSIYYVLSRNSLGSLSFDISK